MLEELSSVRTETAGGAPGEEPAPTSQLGRFRILRTLGHGGFGVVYEAEDPELGRHVAIKVLRHGRIGGAWGELLKREAEAVARLSHPAIVTLHDFGRAEGQVFLVYELLHGESLHDVMRRGPLRRAEAVRILGEVARALAYAHREGVVHRDLTPGNVFLVEGGGVKVVDFGLSLVVGAVGLAAGTRPYAAPEQWQGGAVSASADVHAWGVLALELLSGDSRGADRARRGWLARLRGPLRSLARSACAADPAQRPTDGTALLEALSRIEARRRRWTVAGSVALLCAAALALSLGIAAAKRAPRTPGPFRLAVADVENETGDPSLDGFGTLVAAVLDGAEHLEILGRPRLTGVLRASGRAVPDRIDAESADFAAQQAGAAAVLVPHATRTASGYTLTAVVRRTAAREPWFEVREPARDSAAVVLAAARLGRAIRAALHDREPEVRSPEEEQARAITSSTEAFRQYYEGLLCVERPSRAGSTWVAPDCGRHFREALAIDPEFPLAHLELARVAFWEDESTEAMQRILAPALPQAGRLPARDRAQLFAWKAFLDGDVEGALALLSEATRQFPGDAHLAMASGDLYFRAGHYAEAGESLTRAWELDPGIELALDELVWTLGVLDRTDDLRRLAARLSRATPSPGLMHAQVQARGWLGEHEAAVDLARKAAVGGDRPAQEDLAEALVASGRLDEAEPLVRRLDPDGRGPRRLTGLLLELQGRSREAARYLDPPLPPGAGSLERSSRGFRRSVQLAAARDGAAIRRIADELQAASAESAATLAPMLAYAGDVDGALALRPAFEKNQAAREVLDALVTWRRDGAVAALPALQRLASGEPQVVPTRTLPPEAPSWFAAECAVEAVGGEAALSGVRRFQRFYFPLGAWRAWAYPRSLVLESRLLAELGRRDEARAALDRLDRLWRRADPGQPLLVEARALRGALGRRGAPRKDTPGGRGD